MQYVTGILLGISLFVNFSMANAIQENVDKGYAQGYKDGQLKVIDDLLEDLGKANKFITDVADTDREIDRAGVVHEFLRLTISHLLDEVYLVDKEVSSD